MKKVIIFLFPGDRKFFLFFTGFLFLLLSSFSFAQLSGTYTIGSGGDYATFQAAADALHDQGVSGPVLFKIKSGTYDEQVIFSSIPNAGESNPVTFQPASGDTTDVMVSYSNSLLSNNYVMQLEDAQYVTFRHISFQAGSPTYSKVIVLKNMADHVTFSHCQFHGSFEPYGDVNHALIYSSVSQIKSLVLDSNTFLQGSYAIYLQAADNDPVEAEITNNLFFYLGYAAIYLYSASAPVISGNYIRYCDRGVLMSKAQGGANIGKNKILDIALTGIQMNYFHSETGNEALISNNQIAINKDNVTNPGSGGIYLANADHIKVYYNTSLVYYNHYNNSRAVYIDHCTGSTIEMLNNNFITLNNGYAVYLNESGSLKKCDYNNYYTPGTIFAMWNGTACYNFQELQTVSGDNDHSVFAWPGYNEKYTDLTSRSAWLDGKGTPLSEVTTDINGVVRDATHPDIGANEFTAPPEASPPLYGTKTVGSGGDYDSLQTAVEDARLKGVSDTLRLQLLPGIHNEQCVISPITGASSKRPVIIESSTGNASDVTISYDATGNDDNYILKLKGSSYLQIRNITLEAKNYKWGRILPLQGMVDSLVVDSCIFNGTPQNGYSYPAELISSSYLNFYKQVYHGNIFANGSITFYFSTGVTAPGELVIDGNTFSNCKQAAYLKNISTQFSNNRVTSYYYGLHFWGVTGMLQINNNHIIATKGSGIRLYDCDLQAGSPGFVYNNFVAVTESSISPGIQIENSENIRLDFNSVRSDNLNASPAYLAGNTGIEMENNIFSSYTDKEAVYITNTDFTAADYNCYYTLGENLAYWDQNCTDLDTLKAVSGTNDHSVSVNPGFMSETDLHTKASALDSAGIPIADITTDIDGDLRDPQYPDIGADEFAGLPPHVSKAHYELSIPLDSLGYSTGVWVDYDGDGDLDVMLSGITHDNKYVLKMYGTGSSSGPDSSIAPIRPAKADAVAWGDFDNDGYPDLIIAGSEKPGAFPYPALKLYHVIEGRFYEISAGIRCDFYSSVDWGDYDNDGDLDLLLTGVEKGSAVTKIYRNDGTGGFHKWVFTNIYQTLPGGTSAKWGDYDRDGDLDILLSSSQSPEKVMVYRNMGGGHFETLETGIDDVGGSVMWYDYNNDGYPDIIVAGNSSHNVPVTKIFRNDPDGENRKFTDIGAGLYGLTRASLSCCDYDGDGDADLLITGMDVNNLPKTILYDNLGNDRFEDSGCPFPGLKDGNGQWGDPWSSGNPLLLLTGTIMDPDHPEMPGHGSSAIWENDPSNIIVNTRPQVPDGLEQHIVGSVVVLSWHPATDKETPPDGLTYNLRIGTTPEGSEIVSAMSDASTGNPYLAAPGNAGHNTTWYLTGVQPGRTYYWSVQTVDPEYAGSNFAEEKSFTIPAPYFREKDFPLGIYRGKMAWGDYDNDGDLDMVVTGKDVNNHEFVTRLYKNENGAFTEIDPGFPIVWNSTLKWGDYDNDGDLDLFMAGMTWSGYTSLRVAKIYRNDGNDVFTLYQDIPMAVQGGDAAWGDYDNDGDLDLVITGEHSEDISIAQIFRNDPDGFHMDFDNVDNLEGVKNSSVIWEDYDRDGDLDLLLTGFNNDEDLVAKIYRNDNGILRENTSVVLPGIYKGSVDWGDYDADGYPDILMSGFNRYYSDSYGVINGPVLKIFHNDQLGGFEEPDQKLDSIGGHVVWIDVDNDGDLDFVFTGTQVLNHQNIRRSGVYVNDHGAFVQKDLYFPEAADMAVIDYDNDHRPDVALMGTGRFCVYHNISDRVNHPPEPPGNLQASCQHSMLAFAWSAGSDQETPAEGLSYNLRVGTTPGGSDILTAMADPATGIRQVASDGNTGQNLFWRIFLPDTLTGTCYWSVQAIDNNYLASPFAREQSVRIIPTHNISGEIFQMNHWPLYHSTVYVYTIEDGEPVVDLIQRVSGTNSFTLPAIPEGYVTIKVVPDGIYYRDYISTYLGDTPFYSEASKFYLDKDTSGIRIYVIKIEENNMGTIGISGSMMLSQNGGGKKISVSKGSSSDTGTPLPDVPVSLFNNSGKVIAGDVTDSLGNFSFDSIPAGHYSFYADYKGWPMDAANDSLILDQENHQYKISVVAGKDGIAVESVNDVTAVQDHGTKPQVVVFPNPVRDNLFLKFSETAGTGVTIRFIGIDGNIHKIVRPGAVSENSILSISVSDLPPGLYILSVEGTRINYRHRIIIMH